MFAHRVRVRLQGDGAGGVWCFRALPLPPGRRWAGLRSLPTGISLLPLLPGWAQQRGTIRSLKHAEITNDPCLWPIRLRLRRRRCGRWGVQSERPVRLFAQLQRTELWRVCPRLLRLPRVCRWVLHVRWSRVTGVLWEEQGLGLAGFIVASSHDSGATILPHCLAQNICWHIDLFATGSWNMSYMWMSSFYGIIFLKITNWELLAAGNGSQMNVFRFYLLGLIIKHNIV